MGFDEQYERMIKRQLGGLIGDYATFTEGGLLEKSKQTDNMVETLREFKSRFTHPVNEFKILRVGDMP